MRTDEPTRRRSAYPVETPKPRYGPIPATLNREWDPALTWAGALVRRLDSMTRAEIEAEWSGEIGLAHRAMLKQHAPSGLRGVIDHIMDRLRALPKDEAA